jgi:hypothetical protein
MGKSNCAIYCAIIIHPEMCEKNLIAHSGYTPPVIGFLIFSKN